MTESDGGWGAPGVPRPAVPAVPDAGLLAVRDAVARVVAQPSSGRPVDVALVLQLVAQLQGLGLRELAAMQTSGQYADDGAASAAVWLRGTTVVSDATARASVKLAARVQSELPALGQALVDGSTTLEHVRAAASGLSGLDPAVLGQVQESLVDLVAVASPAQVRRVLRERAEAVDPQLAADADRKRQDRQSLYLDQVPGGSAYLSGQLAPEAAATVLHALDLQCEADRAAGDTRGLPARRADALVHWAQQALHALAGPGDTLAQEAHTVRTHLLITCTAAQLAAMADGQATGQLAAQLTGHDAVAVLTGRTPVDPPRLATGATLLPEALRRLACDATMSLVVHAPVAPPMLDATGHGDPQGSNGTSDGTTDASSTQTPTADTKHPLWVGRASRTVTAAQWRALVVRDRTCIVAGCSRRPAQCQAHHVRHWLDGGPTDLDNLVLLCHAHHHDHHDRGHDLQHRDGRWLTATGWDTGPPG